MNYEEYLERKRQELIKDMEKAGIEQLDYDSDVKTIIRDGNGNVLDIQMKLTLDVIWLLLLLCISLNK